MPDKIFIDTNIIIYSLGKNSTKAHLAAPLFLNSPTISTQVLSETTNVVSKRLGLSNEDIRRLIFWLEATCRIELISSTTINTALDIRERYQFSWYDSLIIATALESSCTILYSEDMQNGQLISASLRIVNPFVS
ncbi:MAG: PIN domain-containing protein [Gammaproteobacteria bacterium]